MIASASASMTGCRPAAATRLVLHLPDEHSDADVYVDGNYIGQARALHSERTGTIELAPGVHRVEVRKPGHFPVQRTVRVDRNPPPQIVIEAELLEDPR